MNALANDSRTLFGAPALQLNHGRARLRFALAWKTSRDRSRLDTAVIGASGSIYRLVYYVEFPLVFGGTIINL